MDDVFNPKTHLLVAVDPITREHFHVTLAELAFDALTLEMPNLPDVAPMLARLDEIEKTIGEPAPELPAIPDIDPLLVRLDTLEKLVMDVQAVQAVPVTTLRPPPPPVDLQPVTEAIAVIASEQRGETSKINARIQAIEHRLGALLSVVEAGLAKVRLS